MRRVSEAGERRRSSAGARFVAAAPCASGVRNAVVRADRDASYAILHPVRAVFAKRERTLANLIGARPLLAVVDRRVMALHGDRIRRQLSGSLNCLRLLESRGGERFKSWEQVERICRAAQACGLPRDGVMLAVGGGTTLDTVGFAASVFRRGTDFVRVPTTLVGLIDVAVGIKQGVNFEGRKNLLGSFHPPLASVNDARFLRTLPIRELRAGMAEIIKIAMIRDPVLFQLLERKGPALLSSAFQGRGAAAAEVLGRAERALLDEIAPDLHEITRARAADFGHTFSPAIESRSRHGITHGEAVAIDIVLSTALAVQLGVCRPAVLDRVCSLYSAMGLPVAQDVCGVAGLLKGLEEIRAHRGGELNLVLPRAIGATTFVQQIDAAELGAALRLTKKLAAERSAV